MIDELHSLLAEHAEDVLTAVVALAAGWCFLRAGQEALGPYLAARRRRRARYLPRTEDDRP